MNAPAPKGEEKLTASRLKNTKQFPHFLTPNQNNMKKHWKLELIMTEFSSSSLFYSSVLSVLFLQLKKIITIHEIRYILQGQT